MTLEQFPSSLAHKKLQHKIDHPRDLLQSIPSVPLAKSSRDAKSVQLRSRNIDLRSSTEGIVFFNGQDSSSVNFKYSFDGSTFQQTGPISPATYARIGTTPFATAFLYIQVLDSSGTVITSLDIFSGDVSVVFLTGNEIFYYSKTYPFWSKLMFANLNSDTSIYWYLFVNGTYFGNFSTAVSSNVNTYVQSIYTSYDASATETSLFTNIAYKLCTDLTAVTCQSYTSPSLGPIPAQEYVWVVFTGSTQQQFTVYTPSYYVTPRTMNTYYNISNNVGYSGASQLVFEALDQSFSPTDLEQYQTENGISYHGVTYDINGHVNDYACLQNCTEANLDVQVITSISQYPTETTFYYDIDPFFGWLDYQVSSLSPPLVQSISYGAAESDLTPSLISSFNTEALKVC